jgi:hypothetical protein
VLGTNGVVEQVVSVGDGGEPLDRIRESSVLPAAAPLVLVDYAKLSQAVVRGRVQLRSRLRLREGEGEQSPEKELVAGGEPQRAEYRRVRRPPAAARVGEVVVGAVDEVRAE